MQELVRYERFKTILGFTQVTFSKGQNVMDVASMCCMRKVLKLNKLCSLLCARGRKQEDNRLHVTKFLAGDVF
jgi:hypothetical protein